MEMIKHQRTQALLTFSVLSVVLSFPLLCKFQILEYGLEQFSFSIHKNYMFLVCNGLLVFIATSSGLITCPSVEADSKAEKSTKSKGYNQREELGSSEKSGSISKEKEVAKEVDQAAQESKMKSSVMVPGTEDLPLVVLEEGEDEQTNEIAGVEEVEDEGFGSMSKEELNRKCEEFIKKMREGIKCEAGQWIMVQ